MLRSSIGQTSNSYLQQNFQFALHMLLLNLPDFLFLYQSLKRWWSIPITKGLIWDAEPCWITDLGLCLIDPFNSMVVFQGKNQCRCGIDHVFSL